MDMREHVRALNETRGRVWEEAKGFLERTQKDHPGQEMSGEERAQWDRYNERLNDLEAEIKSFVDRETAEVEAAQLREASAAVFGEARTEAKTKNDSESFASWARGETRGFTGKLDDGDTVRNAWAISARDIQMAARERDLLRKGATPDEIRALAWDTGSVASAVPTTMARSLYEVLEAEIAMFRMPTTKFQTASGEDMPFPALTAHAIATQVSGQGTTLAGTDPTFGKTTLGAFKYGELVRVANEVITDAIFDVTGFLTRDIGRALGRKIDTDLVTGSGSGKPLGVMASGGTGQAGTVSTGGSLIDPTYEVLVNLAYSVNDAYRNGGNAAWLTRDSTAGTIRKLRDGNGGTLGAPLWTPNLNLGIDRQAQPGFLLDWPLYTDPNVASLASDAKIMAYGDFSAYYIRQVGNVMIERDDSRFFDTDEVGFRGKWRVDGDLFDNTAINILKRSV